MFAVAREMVSFYFGCLIKMTENRCRKNAKRVTKKLKSVIWLRPDGRVE